MRVGCSGCTDRPITAGSTRSTSPGWRCSARASGAGRRCPTNCRTIIEERIVAFSLGHPGLGPRRVRGDACPPRVGRPGRLPQRRLQDAAPPRHLDPRQAPGVDRRLPRPLPAAARTRARATHHHHQARRAGRDRLLLRRPTARHPRRRLAAHRDRHLQLVRLGRARSLRPRRARLAPDQPLRYPASLATCATPAGTSTACSPTTATSSAVVLRSRRSTRSAPATAASAPADPRPTGTSNDCTAPSSKSAGGPPSRASCNLATAVLSANSTPTFTSTTSTEPTPAASPKAEPPPNSSTVPQRWSPDEPNLSAHPGVRST